MPIPPDLDALLKHTVQLDEGHRAGSAGVCGADGAGWRVSPACPAPKSAEGANRGLKQLLEAALAAWKRLIGVKAISNYSVTSGET